jgi:predicted phage tail protein
MSYVDTTVAGATTYRYQVRAVNGGGSSAPSSLITVTLPSPPAAPSNLVATAEPVNNAFNVTLTWTDNSTDERTFTIQRSTSPNFTTVNTFTVAENLTTFTQIGLARNRTFYYRIRANNFGGPSAWSNTATVITQ